MSISSASDALPSDHVWFEPVRSLLHTTLLSSWLQHRPPAAVVCLQASTTAGQALRSFAKSGISSCPVFEGKVYQGFVDCFDILRALLSLVDIRSLTEENREYKLRVAGAYGCTVAALQFFLLGSWLRWQHRWLVVAPTATPLLLRSLTRVIIQNYIRGSTTFWRAGLQLEHQPLRSLNISQDGALIYKADLQSTLHDVVLYGFLQPDSAGCLRVGMHYCLVCAFSVVVVIVKAGRSWHVLLGWPGAAAQAGGTKKA